MNSTHFTYIYMVLDIWQRITQIVREEICCCNYMGYQEPKWLLCTKQVIVPHISKLIYCHRFYFTFMSDNKFSKIHNFSRYMFLLIDFSSASLPYLKHWSYSRNPLIPQLTFKPKEGWKSKSSENTNLPLCLWHQWTDNNELTFNFPHFHVVVLICLPNKQKQEQLLFRTVSALKRSVTFCLNFINSWVNYNKNYWLINLMTQLTESLNWWSISGWLTPLGYSNHNHKNSSKDWDLFCSTNNLFI